MAAPGESNVLSDSESDSSSSVDHKTIKSDSKTTSLLGTQLTSTTCQVSSVDGSCPSQEVIRSTQNIGRQTFSAIRNDLEINPYSFPTNEGGPSNDIGRSIGWPHDDEGARCNITAWDVPDITFGLGTVR